MALKDVLESSVRPGTLVEPLDERRIRCVACGHACPLPDGAAGVCKVRFNRGGTLYVPWGYVGGVQCDPVEKKPFFHVAARQPGVQLRHAGVRPALRLLPELGDVAGAARSQRGGPAALHRSGDAGPRGRAASARDCWSRPTTSRSSPPSGRSRSSGTPAAPGLLTAFVSNGNATPQVLDYLQPHIDCYKVDLKSFDDKHYRQLGGRLAPILETIASLHARGIWVEVVTLLVPGFNDSSAETRRDLTAVSCGRLAGHPVARHGVSRRLPHDRSARHDRRIS